jgi:hypothetical protein
LQVPLHDDVLSYYLSGLGLSLADSSILLILLVLLQQYHTAITTVLMESIRRLLVQHLAKVSFTLFQFNYPV